MQHEQSKQLELGYLVLLNVLSYGLYSFYWFYQNWKHLEALREKRIRPALHTVGLLVPLLNIYLVAEQWKQIHSLTREEGAPYFPLSWTLLGYLLLGYGYSAFSILMMVIFLTDNPLTGGELAGSMYIDLITFTVSGLLMTVPQRALNAYWSHHESTPVSRLLTPGQIAWIALGGLAWAITALQPFFVTVV